MQNLLQLRTAGGTKSKSYKSQTSACLEPSNPSFPIIPWLLVMFQSWLDMALGNLLSITLVKQRVGLGVLGSSNLSHSVLQQHLNAGAYCAGYCIEVMDLISQSLFCQLFPGTKPSTPTAFQKTSCFLGAALPVRSRYSTLASSLPARPKSVHHMKPPPAVATRRHLGKRQG